MFFLLYKFEKIFALSLMLGEEEGHPTCAGRGAGRGSLKQSMSCNQGLKMLNVPGLVERERAPAEGWMQVFLFCCVSFNKHAWLVEKRAFAKVFENSLAS